MVPTQMTATRTQLLVTYQGDITKKLNECGTSCPHRLNADGNTEQIIEMLKGDINTPQEIRDMIEEMVLLDCANIGTVISHAWQFIQVEEVAP